MGRAREDKSSHAHKSESTHNEHVTGSRAVWFDPQGRHIPFPTDLERISRTRPSLHKQPATLIIHRGEYNYIRIHKAAEKQDEVVQRTKDLESRVNCLSGRLEQASHYSASRPFHNTLPYHQATAGLLCCVRGHRH